MKPKRGPWYWLSMSNVFLLFFAVRGVFGPEAQEQASMAQEELAPAMPILLSIFAVAGIVLAAYLAYTL